MNDIPRGRAWCCAFVSHQEMQRGLWGARIIDRKIKLILLLPAFSERQGNLKWKRSELAWVKELYPRGVGSVVSWSLELSCISEGISFCDPYCVFIFFNYLVVWDVCLLLFIKFKLDCDWIEGKGSAHQLVGKNCRSWTPQEQVCPMQRWALLEFQGKCAEI